MDVDLVSSFDMLSVVNLSFAFQADAIDYLTTTNNIGGPAHVCFIGILGQQYLAVLTIGGRILHFDIHKCQSEFVGHFFIVKGHFVANAAVFGGELEER